MDKRLMQTCGAERRRMQSNHAYWEPVDAAVDSSHQIRIDERSGIAHELRRFAYDLYLAMCNTLLAFPGHRFRIWVLRHIVRASIGDGTSVGRRVRVEGKGGLKIGENCNVNARAHLDGRGGLVVGALVNISPEVMLLSAGHDVHDPGFEGRSARTMIGDRAWIASRAIVLPGAEIGEGAVVAAGSVVRGRVMPWTVVAGNPARPVAKREPSAQQDLPPYRRWFG